MLLEAIGFTQEAFDAIAGYGVATAPANGDAKFAGGFVGAAEDVDGERMMLAFTTFFIGCVDSLPSLELLVSAKAVVQGGGAGILWRLWGRWVHGVIVPESGGCCLAGV